MVSWPRLFSLGIGLVQPVSMLICVSVFLTSNILLAANDQERTHLRLGVLAPTSGSNASIGKQVTAGVESAADRISDIDVSVVSFDWDGIDIDHALSVLTQESVDAIIASIIGSQVQELAGWASERNSVPIAVLALNHDPEHLKVLSEYDHVLTFGYTFTDFNRLALSTWANELPIREPLILHKDQHEFSEQLGQALARDLEIPTDTKVRTLAITDIDRLFEEGFDADGIVLIGRPTETINWMEAIRGEEGSVPIFLPGVHINVSPNLNDYYNLSDVYHGSVVWSTNEEIESQNELSTALDMIRQKLGWQKHAFSTFALDAFGATHVVAAGWRVWRRESNQSEEFFSWSAIQEDVSGENLDDFKIGYSVDTGGWVVPGYLTDGANGNWIPFKSLGGGDLLK